MRELSGEPAHGSWNRIAWLRNDSLAMRIAHGVRVNGRVFATLMIRVGFGT